MSFEARRPKQSVSDLLLNVFSAMLANLLTAALLYHVAIANGYVEADEDLASAASFLLVLALAGIGNVLMLRFFMSGRGAERSATATRVSNVISAFLAAGALIPIASGLGWL